MNTNYQKALKYYNQYNYEEAYDVLSSSNNLDEKSQKLLEECKKQILQQYVYLINDYEGKWKTNKANELRERYIQKYGNNSLISKPEDDDNSSLILITIVALGFILWLVVMLILSIIKNL